MQLCLSLISGYDISWHHDILGPSFPTSSDVFDKNVTSTASVLFFSLNLPWRYQICMAKCVYSYRDDLPKKLFKITAQEQKAHFWLTCVVEKRRCLNLKLPLWDGKPYDVQQNVRKIDVQNELQQLPWYTFDSMSDFCWEHLSNHVQ